MEYLLDTHTFIWFIEGNPQISANAKKLLESLQNKFISIASFLEIAIKYSKGKLQLAMSFDDLEKEASNNKFNLLPISFEATSKLISLPMHHNNPFDRIIISQALTQNLSIITKDPLIIPYGVPVIW